MKFPTTPITMAAISAAMLVCCAASNIARADDIDWCTVDGGGGASFGGDYTLEGTIAQPDAGLMTGGDYTLEGGFWTTSPGSACDTIDFNRDGLYPDTNDIDEFISVFSGGPCSNDPNCGDIDFNNDGLYPDTTDIDALLSVFSGGPCF